MLGWVLVGMAAVVGVWLGLVALWTVGRWSQRAYHRELEQTIMTNMEVPYETVDTVRGPVAPTGVQYIRPPDVLRDRADRVV
jgi:hypothetical protein